MTDRFTSTLLIPAAGFGKRLQMPKAKELLVHHTETRPLIDWSLDLGQRYFSRTVVISRNDKQDLNAYLEEKNNIEVYKIDSSVEWPDTILKAKSIWGDTNLVVLPDTRFSSTSLLQMMNLSLQKNAFTFACIKKEDPSTWGILRTENGFYVAEKPQTQLPSDSVWGLFGFQKQYGDNLLGAFLNSKGSYVSIFPQQVSVFDLDHFEDLSRQGANAFSL